MKKIYLISSIIDNKILYKIGISKSPKTRFKQLKTGNPGLIDIVIESEVGKYASKVEAVLHNLYKCKNINGEWFELSKTDVNDFNNLCQRLKNNFVILEQSTLHDNF